MVQKIHRFAILNSFSNSSFAKPFPVKKIQYYWDESLELISNIRETVVNVCQTNNNATFKANVHIPGKATENLEIIKLDEPAKRSILFCDNDYQYKTPTTFKKIQQDEPPLDPSAVLEEERRKIIGKIDTEELEISLELNDEAKEDVYFSKSGDEMLIEYVGLPTIDQQIISYAESINLYDNSGSAFPERAFLADLESKICSFEQIVDIRNPLFIEVLSIITETLKYDVNLDVFFESINSLVDKKDFIRRDVDKGDDEEFELFIFRIIISHKLYTFLSNVTSNRQTLYRVYGHFTPFSVIPFLRDFMRIAKRMDNFIYKGTLPSKFAHVEVKIPNMTSNIIWDRKELLISKLRNGTVEEREFFEFVFSIVKFINDGFIVRNKPDSVNCWGLFKMISIEAKHDYNGLLLAANEIVESMKDNTAHILILNLAKEAVKYNTHISGSPILNQFGVLSVAQCILEVSSFPLSSFTGSILSYSYLLN